MCYFLLICLKKVAYLVFRFKLFLSILILEIYLLKTMLRGGYLNFTGFDESD